MTDETNPTEEEEVPEGFIDGQPDILGTFRRHEQAQKDFDGLDPETRTEQERAWQNENQPA